MAYLFEQQPHRLAADLLQWMMASTRFSAFVETYRDKIRKKIRVTHEPESILDLRAELEVAYRLLNDRRLAVTYEPYASAKRRGPDYAVSYRVNLVFNIEVARLRYEESGAENSQRGAENSQRGSDQPQRGAERLQRIVLYKLGQMQAGMGNLLVVQCHAALVQSLDLNRVMQDLKTRAEGKAPDFYAASGYSGPAAFYKEFLHLSGILLWASGAASDPAAQVWVNKQARPGLEENIVRQVSLLLPGAPPA